MFTANRVMSGTWGEVWFEGDLVAEITAFQAKVSFNKSSIGIAGQMEEDAKITSTKGTGSVTMHKINSRMLQVVGNQIQGGRDRRYTIISKVQDPDAYGAERVRYTGVSFDDITYADWSHGQPMSITCPFTFVKAVPIDTVTPQ